MPRASHFKEQLARLLTTPDREAGWSVFGMRVPSKNARCRVRAPSRLNVALHGRRWQVSSCTLVRKSSGCAV